MNFGVGFDGSFVRQKHSVFVAVLKTEKWTAIGAMLATRLLLDENKKTVVGGASCAWMRKVTSSTPADDCIEVLDSSLLHRWGGGGGRRGSVAPRGGWGGRGGGPSLLALT